jgi:hypothetical protein
MGKVGDIEIRGAELADYNGRRARKGLLLPRKFRADEVLPAAP